MDSNKHTFVEQDSEKKKKKRKTCESKSNYKQIMSDKPIKTSGKGKRTKMCDIYNDAEDQYMCLERAAFFLERLDAELPKFAKCMLPSNVLYSFWLILPRKFCVMHFPDDDSTIILVDESGKEFKTNYLKARHGLSAGWRGFTTAQRLLQGDILFFRLIEPCKLQVNIVRRYSLEAIEAAVCLMEMHPRIKKTRASNYFDKSAEVKKEKIKQKEVKEEDENDLRNQIPLLIQTKKGKRTRRSPKKCIARLSLDFCSTQENGEIDQCDISNDGLSSEIVQGVTSAMTNESQPYKLNLGYHEANINCHSTAERIFHSSTLAT